MVLLALMIHFFKQRKKYWRLNVGFQTAAPKSLARQRYDEDSERVACQMPGRAITSEVRVRHRFRSYIICPNRRRLVRCFQSTDIVGELKHFGS